MHLVEPELLDEDGGLLELSFCGAQLVVVALGLFDCLPELLPQQLLSTVRGLPEVVILALELGDPSEQLVTPPQP